MSDANQPPVASGDLAKTPFAHLLLYLYHHRSSGTLVVHVEGSEYRALFHRGRVVAAEVAQPTAALEDALLPLVGVTAGSFTFHDADLVGSGSSVVTGMFDPSAFVVRAARTHVREQTVAQLLSKYGDAQLVLDPAADLSRLALASDELRFVALLKQAPFSCEALPTLIGLSHDAARRLVYSLLVTRVLRRDVPSHDRVSQRSTSDGAPAGRPNASSVSPVSLRPPGPRPSSDAWRAIASVAGAMAEGRPPSDPVRSSRPSSSRLPSQAAPRANSQPLAGGSGGGDVRNSRPISRPLSEPLADDARYSDRRSLTPDRGLPRARPSTPPRMTSRPSLPAVETLDAEGRFRRVELLCQRNAYREALPIMRALLEQNRKSARYLGMLSHVLFGRTTDTNFGKELVDCVNRALRIDPDEVHALYTKARCYKRLGKEREALHYFRRTLAADPTHLDAAREARLLVSRLNDKRKR